MSIPLGTFRPPAIAGTDLCIALALGREEARRFFAAPAFDLRLATATYLELLELARSPQEVARVRRFAAGFPVLSLGPMASSLAVEILSGPGKPRGLTALRALAAATAAAHEIPLLTYEPDRYEGIDGLDARVP
jgi:predicted nucleic acid-binding protein